tara:strand:- start:11362 stop:12573 length:1212 start_codon:yes stop_codon:yes gene_type:complete
MAPQTHFGRVLVSESTQNTAESVMKLDDADVTLFRDSVRSFLEKEVEPYYNDWERAGIWPRDLWRNMGENGFLCVDMPAEYGGTGAPFDLSCVVVEEVSRAGYGALSSAVCVHSDIVAPYVLHMGTEEQKHHWISRLATGDAVGAIGMTEPGAGSDLQNIKTSAIRDGDDYVINGQKTFITNGQHCDLLILATKTDPKQGARGVTLFTVDTGLPGFERGRNLEKMGLHSGDTSELFFNDLHVPAYSILGGLGNGFAALMDELPRERLIMAVGCVAASDGMLDWTIEYTMERRTFGEPVAKYQNTRFAFADMKTDIELNRALVEKYVGRYMDGDLSTEEAAMCKLASSEMQGRVADRCVQLFGGYGYMSEYKISRAYVDARVQRIYGGTSEIMKEVIARSLVGR